MLLRDPVLPGRSWVLSSETRYFNYISLIPRCIEVLYGYSTALPTLTNAGPIRIARQFRNVPTVISPR